MSERDKTAAVKRNSPAREIWRRFKKNKAAMLGLGIFSVMVLLAVFADVICDYDTQVIAQDVANRLKAPSSAHWFGTDAYGRDIFARVVHGARISIIIGLAATVGSVCISGILGSIAGYYGGRIDNVIMRVLDTFLAIPGELLAMAIVASLGPSMTNLLIAVTIA
ncbi:MAG: ABC transporter permease, partial [Clostridiales bacterium]|nr:ABC transporter permease [Clostridiales bacterium]